VRATDPALFECPFLFASDVGTARFNDAEVTALREYLRKGGFLWVDDFWGNLAWRYWVEEMQRVLPGHDVVRLTTEHPLFSTFYFVQEIPQIPNIGFWRRSGGETSEFGAATEQATISGIHDERGRLPVRGPVDARSAAFNATSRRVGISHCGCSAYKFLVISVSLFVSKCGSRISRFTKTARPNGLKPMSGRSSCVLLSTNAPSTQAGYGPTDACWSCSTTPHEEPRHPVRQSNPSA
jgi:hypothetical protein